MTHDELTKKVGLEVHSVLSRANVIAYLDMPIDTATDVARAALAIAMPAAFEMAAEVADKRAEDRFADFGTTEPDTNASYYSGRRGEALDELDEEDWHIAEAIRAEGEKWE